MEELQRESNISLMPDKSIYEIKKFINKLQIKFDVHCFYFQIITNATIARFIASAKL